MSSWLYLSEHKSPQNITMGSSFSSTSNADPSVPGENSTAAYPPLINDGPTIAEVTNVINVIMSCVDDDRLGASTRFSDLFTSDGSVTIVKTGTTKSGREELKGLCEFLHNRFPGCLHVESNVVLTRHPTESRVVVNRSYWMCVKPDGSIVSGGRHEDEFVRERRFVCRKRVITHMIGG